MGRIICFGDLGQERKQFNDTFKRLPEYPQAESVSFEKELLGIINRSSLGAKALSYLPKRQRKQLGEFRYSSAQRNRN